MLTNHGKKFINDVNVVEILNALEKEDYIEDYNNDQIAMNAIWLIVCDEYERSITPFTRPYNMEIVEFVNDRTFKIHLTKAIINDIYYDNDDNKPPEDNMEILRFYVEDGKVTNFDFHRIKQDYIWWAERFTGCKYKGYADMI